ncbi:MAG: phosphate acetyltransferase [Spirochaetaceae bacterium]|nr:phosphate acetyltransferase [Spirochaetaceae bacterium]
MNFIEKQKESARKLQKVLVLPEGYEPRTLKAARAILDEKLAGEVILLDKNGAIKEIAAGNGINLDGFTIIDPATDSRLDDYTGAYYEMRKHKGISQQDARKVMMGNLYFGSMMLHKGHADALVAGADHPTSDVLVAGFTIVKTAPDVKYASSCFVMDVPNKAMGADGLFIFADCATIPEPTAEQLAEIAIAACESCKAFLKVEPVCAMLSFSTKGSASHPNVDKVLEALKIVKARRPDLNVDGELQLDAAVAPDVAAKKAPGSAVAGKANVLVFPDLQSGNIGYKLVQRFAGGGAYGPFMQGFAKPLSDLSRGATIEDIINTCATVLSSCKE